MRYDFRDINRIVDQSLLLGMYLPWVKVPEYLRDMSSVKSQLRAFYLVNHTIHMSSCSFINIDSEESNLFLQDIKCAKFSALVCNLRWSNLPNYS